MPGPSDARRRGAESEQAAEAHLKSLGFEIFARNVRTKSGEIDLIVREGTTVVVVEVKRRATAGEAVRALDAAKRLRLLRAYREARVKLALPASAPVRFDLVIVVDGAPPRHRRGAFGPRDPSGG